jgi:hypothetical protein
MERNRSGNMCDYSFVGKQGSVALKWSNIKLAFLGVCFITSANPKLGVCVLLALTMVDWSIQPGAYGLARLPAAELWPCFTKREVCICAVSVMHPIHHRLLNVVLRSAMTSCSLCICSCCSKILQNCNIFNVNISSVTGTTLCGAIVLARSHLAKP